MSKFNNVPGFDSIRPGADKALRMTNTDAAEILKHLEADIYGRIAIAKAIDALIGPWVKTSDRLPTKDDEGVYGTVLAFNPVLLDGEYGACTCITAQTVIDYPDWWIKWMPIPPLPEVEE